jgi:hypothetical protein
LPGYWGAGSHSQCGYKLARSQGGYIGSIRRPPCSRCQVTAVGPLLIMQLSRYGFCWYLVCGAASQMRCRFVLAVPKSGYALVLLLSRYGDRYVICHSAVRIRLWLCYLNFFHAAIRIRVQYVTCPASMRKQQ